MFLDARRSNAIYPPLGMMFIKFDDPLTRNSSRSNMNVEDLKMHQFEKFLWQKKKQEIFLKKGSVAPFVV